jgi:hypothetical protein
MRVLGVGKKSFAALAVGVLLGLYSAAQVRASVPIFAPTDGAAVIGGRSDGTNFTAAVAGTVGGANNFPAGESPNHVVDGVGQKYLNFARLDTGFLITPGVGASVADSLKLWTANDAVERDPASYSLLGTNSPISGAGPFALSNFSLISSGALALPSTRNGGGTTALDDANSQTASFANSNSYLTYLVLFPTVKGPGGNSMQIAEVQLFGTVPEPTTLSLLGLGAMGLLARRRRA